MSSTCSNFTLPSNPDAAGVGVRSAIYLQNFLCLVPAMLAVWDGKVTPDELEFVENQAASNVALSLSILIAAIIQAKTLGLTAYHAHIVLSICSLNNNIALVYILLLISYVPGSSSETQVRSLDSTEAPTPTPRTRVFTFTGLYLILTGALGLWMWSNPYSFSRNDGNRDEIDCVSIRYPVIFINAHFSSRTLRGFSLAWYSSFISTGLFALLIGLVARLMMKEVGPGLWGRGGGDSDDDSDVTSSGPGRRLEPFIRMTTLLITNVLYIIPMELTIKSNRHLQNSDEDVWTFGQTLALLVLLVPIRDTIKLLQDTISQHIKSSQPATLAAVANSNGVDNELHGTGAKHNTEVGQQEPPSQVSASTP